MVCCNTLVSANVWQGFVRADHPWSRCNSLGHTNIFTLRCYSLAMKHKTTVVNIFQWKTPVTWPKNLHRFFPLLWVICRFGINIRIQVHFFLFAFGNEEHLSCVSFWEALRASQDLHVTIVLLVPNTNQKSVLQSLSKSFYHSSFTW